MRTLFLVAAFHLLAPTATAESVVFGGRSSNLVVPNGYDPGTPAPLVVLLHGYTSNGAAQDAYMGFSTIADEFGFLMLNPDGLIDGGGERFWNATDACCNFYGSTVSDSDFLRGLISETRSLYNIDPRRIYVTGHSNGGFMSFRMACDHADLVAAIASLAGATWDDPADCNPSEPVDILQIHGTVDDTIFYGGGSILATPYPSAAGSVDRWNTYNGCSGVPDSSAPPLDLDSSLAGAETSILRYLDGCSAGGRGELWTIEAGGHVPTLSAEYARSVPEDPRFGIRPHARHRTAPRPRDRTRPRIHRPAPAPMATHYRVDRRSTQELRSSEDALKSPTQHPRDAPGSGK